MTTDGPREQRVDELRSLPAVGALLSRPSVGLLIATHGHAAVAQAAREAVARAREELQQGRSAIVSEAAIAARARALTSGLLRPVINATGIVVHTNLGRVPLAPEALASMERIGRGYSTLEYDLDEGRRGHRHVHVSELLSTLTGAEDALVVNNNAAAMLLALGTLATGREAIVSRGELVEIGGGFRIPDVVTQSGARLREVGTTNRTHLRDYEAAIGEGTALLLKVHRSNFEIVGFTAEVDVGPLAELAHARGLFLVHDAGSGCMPAVAPFVREPSVADHVAAGADLVTFSGDKLLGGPQAGIVVGRRELIERLRRAPLYRALRPDKLTLAALMATLVLWRDRPDAIPLVRMVSEPASELEGRCRRVLERVGARSGTLEVAATIARVGGGAAPSVELESRAIRVRDVDALRLAALLRAGDPPVVARIEDGALWLDLRCVAVDEEAVLGEALRAALDALG